MLDWFAEASSHHDNISCGFELDTKEGNIPAAAIHFQPRAKRELVRPFMESIDAGERAHLYLDTDDRLPQGWALSFLGLFRGRPASPLRVCGYFHKDVQERCKGNPQALAEVFRQVGFHAYDDIMLRQATKLIGLAPAQLDFQLDVLPDGSMSDTFALDVSFNMERSDRVIESFAHGDASRIMGCFRDFGVTDERADIVADASITRMLPMVADDGSLVRFAFTLMPLWIKARWVAGELVPAKLYYQAVARPV